MILAAVAMFAVVSCGSKKTEEVATDSVAVEADTTAVVEVDSSATEAAVL